MKVCLPVTELNDSAEDTARKLLAVLRAAADIAVKSNVPKLEGSGVEYRHRESESFSMPELCLQRRHAEIDELCVWRVAELRAAGDKDAKIRVQWMTRDGVRYLTCVVERAPGFVEGQKFLEQLAKGVVTDG